MSKFVGNDTHTFDIEKIVIIWWRCYIDEHAKDVAHICFIDGNEVYLHYECDKDYRLINDMRKYFKQLPLPRVE